jgi:two-component system, sensor histidine kinase
MRANAHAKGLALTVEIASNVPEHVQCDAVRLNQVLTNLLGNAIKFTDHGQVTLHILKTGGNDTTATLSFTVTDTGIGIPADKQSTIFEAFSQGDTSASRRHNGTGLGLSIAARLIDLMDSKITVTSALGRGSTFSFSLTLPIANISKTASKTSEPETPSNSSTLNTLIVDDNAVNQWVVHRLLTGLGHHVAIAESGAQALERTGKERFDLILMDIQMPDMDGYQTTEAIRAIEQTTEHRSTIIALTAHAHPEDEARCLATGMDGHLTKPLDIDKLSQLLARLKSVSH